MAATFTVSNIEPVQKAPQALGQLREVICKIAASGTYTDGGDALAASAFGLQAIVHFSATPNQIVMTAGSSTAFLPVYDYVNSKLKFFKANGTTNLLEATGATVTTGTNGEMYARIVGY